MDYVPQTDLEKLNELYSSGFITEWEYNNRKKELVGDEKNKNNIDNNNNNNNNNNDFNRIDYSQSFNYNQVIPVLNNDFQSYDNSNNCYNDNNYYGNNNNNNNNNQFSDYNQVIPVSYEDVEQTIPIISSNDYYNNDDINSYNYNYNNHTTQEIQTTPIEYYNYNEQLIIPETIVVPEKKNNFIANKNIDIEKANKKVEYPLKVENNYTIHKDIGNNMVLYFKDKESNYQSDLIPLFGKSKIDIIIEMYNFVGLKVDNFTSTTILIYKLTIDDKRLPKENEFINFNSGVKPQLLKANDNELLKPNHFLIEICYYTAHRSRWTPNTKFTFPIFINSFSKPYKGTECEPGIKINRNKNPYVIDKFISDSSIPQYGFFTFEEPKNTSPQSIPEKVKPSNILKPKKDDNWLKLNFFNLFRFLQNGSNKFIFSTDTENNGPKKNSPKTVDILIPLKSAIDNNRCISCGVYSTHFFLCDQHYNKDLLEAYDQCKHILFENSNGSTFNSRVEEKQKIKKEYQEKKDQETVFIKEKFAYIDPATFDK